MNLHRHPFAFAFATARGTAQRQCGVSLVETLVSLAVLAAAALGTVTSQGQLRLQADLARQRGEALHLAEQHLEAARQFASVQADPGRSSFEALAGTGGPQTMAPTASQAFELTQDVVTDPASQSKLVHAQARWTDRAGRAQQAVLATLVAPVPPLLAGSLVLGTPATLAATPLGRHPAVPVAAQPLGDGRSVLRPTPALLWVFSDRSGEPLGQCALGAAQAGQPVTAALVDGCLQRLPAGGQLLAGHVRFATGAALGLRVQLDLGGTAQGSSCHSNAPGSASAAAGQAVVSYSCLVLGASASGWSGRLLLQPEPFADTGGTWSVAGSGANAYRVCRYSSAPADAAEVANADHPASYRNVKGALTHQNYLVVPAAQPCPADAAQAAGAGLPADAQGATRPHQPQA
jgi:Tfp pilus assembly protein PilV